MTGPIRISDRLRNFIVYGDTILTPFEASLLERYARLENWNDHTVYKNEKGQIYPEILYFMFAIKSYYDVKEAQAGKSSIDI